MEWLEWRFLDTGEEYLLYWELCFIPDEYDDVNRIVGSTTRSVCSALCSGPYNRQCSGFIYDRHSHRCVLTPFTGETVTGYEATEALKRGCNGSTFEFYRRVRHLGMYVEMFSWLDSII